MKIVFLDSSSLNPDELYWRALEQLGEVAVYDHSAPEQVVERLANADVAITSKVALGEAVFSQCPTLKFITITATGYNIIDVNAARARGIAVSNVPSYGTTTVAQFTAALLLALCNRVSECSVEVHARGWNQHDSESYWLNPMVELAGKKIGIIGYGRIGQAFGAIAQAMGMTVLACTTSAAKSAENSNVRYVDYDTLYAEANVISLHCPLTPATKEMINRSTLQKMKPGVLLLNTSRGGLVNEADLAAALNEGHVAGAAVDVLSSEPPAADNPLLSAKNCLITPHIAWASVEARGRILATTRGNVAAFIAGQPQNQVN